MKGKYRQKSKKMITSRPSFPLEIIREILLKVPAESLLLRCKPVCKEWYSLISDQHFIKSHYALSSTNYRNHRLICIDNEYPHIRTNRLNLPPEHFLRCKSDCDYGDGQQFLISCPLDDVFFDKSIDNHMCLQCPVRPTWSQGPTIVGSCNGLMCIYEVYTFTLFLYNPTTRRSNLLPCYRPISSSRVGYYHGFGYDEVSDDYKVVKISTKPESSDLIYSLKTGKWKEIGHSPCAGNAKFLNGALHWAGGPRKLDSWKIVSLDLANETYGEVLLPECEFHEDYGCLDWGVLGEWLCVIYSYFINNLKGYAVDVWVMKVYGVKDSWTKLASIPNPYSGVGRFVSPLCISQDGKLLNFKRKLFVYDSKDGSSSVIDKVCSDACIVVKSLVSPFPPLGLADNNDDEDLRPQ